MPMVSYSRSWWGQRFISAIEEFTEPGRLSRGRGYARNSKIISIDVDPGEVYAQIRGSVNPYFGVYKEPTYFTTLRILPIPSAIWLEIIQTLATNASVVSKLLLNEVPNNIEGSFAEMGQFLLPRNGHDLETHCTCPDYYEPCKHVAGLCYKFASLLDDDPFLLFKLRGMPQEQFLAALAETPLGRALKVGLQREAIAPYPAQSYYPQPQRQDLAAEARSLKAFWSLPQPLPDPPAQSTGAIVSGVIIKKQGDYPKFWHRDNSFIDTMTELYERVKTKNKDLL